jgi:hypothetical protein
MLTLLSMSEQQRGRRAIEVGPTGRTVAENLVRLRERRGLTTRQLSGMLERAGRHIPASGITRMEQAKRGVTTDELVALAVALNVSPAALLLPCDARQDIEITGAGVVNGTAAWQWMWSNEPLSFPEGDDEEVDRALVAFLLDSRPLGLVSAQGDDRLLSAGLGVRPRPRQDSDG